MSTVRYLVGSRDYQDGADDGYLIGQRDLMKAVRQDTGDEPVTVAMHPWVVSDYAMWCLGHNLAVVGAMRQAYIQGGIDYETEAWAGIGR